MDFYYESSADLGAPLYEIYANNALEIIRQVRRDKTLSAFDQFNKRFKISWGLRIHFTDNLRITQESTRNCYMLMLKISDLWFAFEHLVNTVEGVFPRDKYAKSKVDFYTNSTLEKLGFTPVTNHFNQILWEHVLGRTEWRRDMYPFLAYFKNNTKGAAHKGVAESINLIKKKQPLAEWHVFSLSYGVRNLYAHEGVAAALGGKNYQVRERYYMVIYDTLILYSLVLGNVFCEKKLNELSK